MVFFIISHVNGTWLRANIRRLHGTGHQCATIGAEVIMALSYSLADIKKMIAYMDNKYALILDVVVSGITGLANTTGLYLGIFRMPVRRR